jgi:hypothetical protein
MRVLLQVAMTVCICSSGAWAGSDHALVEKAQEEQMKILAHRTGMGLDPTGVDVIYHPSNNVQFSTRAMIEEQRALKLSATSYPVHGPLNMSATSYPQ